MEVGFKKGGEPVLIYKATNKLNGHIYIGQTVHSLERRWIEHLRDTRKGSSNIFHNAIRKYGAETFTLEQIDIACSLNELNKKEIYWIAFYKSNRCKYPEHNGYNMTDGGEGVVGNKINEETRQRLIQSHLGQVAWNKGKKMSDKFCTTMSNVRQQQWQSEEYRKRNKTNKGKAIHNEETIQKYRELWLGENNPRARAVLCIENNTVYKTIKDASIELNIGYASISNCIAGRSKTAGHLHFKEVI